MAGRTQASFGPVAADVIGREAFIRNKRASAGPAISAISKRLENRPLQIRILVTGGTFDKEYDELSGTALLQATPTSQEMLRLGRARLDSRSRP